MQTITIDIINDKAVKLLQDLESRQLIHMHTEASASPALTGAKYRGALHLTDEQYNDFQQHATNIRKEWE